MNNKTATAGKLTLWSVLFLGCLTFVNLCPFWAVGAPAGEVKAWGANGTGQLGDGTTISSLTPVAVAAPSGVAAVSSGANHNLAIKADGTVWSWGSNRYGQLGIGTTADNSLPQRAGSFNTVIMVAAGGYHSLALLTGGKVWAWGLNKYGQLGDGTKQSNSDPNPDPKLVTGLDDVIAVAAGIYHSLALKADGTVWGWGRNYNGQLGTGTNIDSLVPVQVIGLSGVTAIATGCYHSLALKTDGTAWAWGYNTDGQLGDGSVLTKNVPVQVSGLANVTALAGGGYHSLALTSDGFLWDWGDNAYGQLGSGNKEDSSRPVQCILPMGAKMIAGGWSHSLAVTVDGSGFSWGYNSSGQLGIGPIADSTIPLPISGLTGIVALSGGGAHSLAILGTDTPPPVTTVSQSPLPNSNGWNNTPVQLDLLSSVNGNASGVKEISYSASGAQTIPPTATAGPSVSFWISEPGLTDVSYYATAQLGGTEPARSLSVKIDNVSPVIVFAGNAGTYTPDKNVEITCSVVDDLSGVDSSTCQDIKGPASSFALGTNTFSAAAIDKAGNSGNASTSFTVVVGYDALSAMTRQFVSKPGIANSLCAKLDAAKAAAARGDSPARADRLRSFVQEVTAQSGKSLSPQQADLLISLAGSLL